MDPSIRPSAFGFLPFDKPKGMTSRDLANRVQRRLRRETENRKLKVGHTGTLDPLARGLIVLAVGAATRLTPWMLQPTKRYHATFRLGAHSDSGDLEEPVTEVENPNIPTHHELTNSLSRFDGWIDQIPPSHSAIWVDGQRAHERIRRGETVDMPTRRVWIGSIELLRYEYPVFEIDVVCGSGTYLRSLGIDIAAACDAATVMTDLSRTAVGGFLLRDAIGVIPPNDPPPVDGRPLRYGLSPMDLSESPWLCDRILRPEPALSHLPHLALDAENARRVRHGLTVTGEGTFPSNPNVPPADGNNSKTPAEIVTMDPNGELVAIMRRKKNEWSPYRVFAPRNERVH